MNTEPMNFEVLTRVEIPITVKGVQYILTEADGDAATRYRSASIRGAVMEMGEDGQRKISQLDQLSEAEPTLVSRCLYIPDPQTEGFKLRLTPEGDPDNKFLVPITTIKRWPAKVQKALFERIKEISDLDETEDTASLEKQIAKLQDKLAKIRSKEEITKNS